MLVKEVMKSNIESCRPDSNLESIALMMWNHDCGAIPVTDEQGKPVGIITDRDIAMGSSLNHRCLWELTANDIMAKRPLYSCQSEDNMAQVLEVMKEHQIRRVPVVDDEGRLTGIVALGDVVDVAAKTATKKSNSKLTYSDVMDTIKAISKQNSHTLVQVA